MTDNQREQGLVTLEQIDQAWEEGTNSDIDKLARRLLEERNAFRAVAIRFFRFDYDFLETVPDLSTEEVRAFINAEVQRRVDSAAQRLMEKKEGE